MGFRGSGGLGIKFRVWSLGVWGLGLRVAVSGLNGVSGSALRIWNLGFRVSRSVLEHESSFL